MQSALKSNDRAQGLLSKAPQLFVVVDTEEEFDWSKPHSRGETRVSHVRQLGRAQRIFEKYAIRPTYVVDYPIASQSAAYEPLREWFSAGTCEIGAHLHPWVNPPFDEEVTPRNSYPGNLPAELERQKLQRLTETISANLKCRPTTYRAGRYGIGANTGAILEELGYELDTSVVPFTDFGADGGPNFTRFDTRPFRIGPQRRILEVPLTVGWCGTLRDRHAMLWPFLSSAVGLSLHLPGVFARGGLLEKVRLTPEGTNFAELKRLTETLLRAGERIFVFSYHSPSVAPGHTPYVRDERERESFLGLLEEYCTYFFGFCGGVAATMQSLQALAKKYDGLPAQAWNH